MRTPPPGFLPDTSVMVAAVCAWHEQHGAATVEIEKRLSTGQRMVVAAHALIEAYAVLTRLPPPHRLAPADAHAVVAANFITGRKIISLDGAGTTTLLRALAREEIGGGRTYDAVIAECARRVKAAALLTFNAAHFEAFGGAALEITVPTTGRG